MTGPNDSERKLKLDVSNDDGITPLHDAVVNNLIGTAKLLLQHGGVLDFLFITIGC